MSVRFSGHVRQWRDDKPGGLTVVDIPDEVGLEIARDERPRSASPA